MSLKVNQIKAKLLAMFQQHLDLSDIGINDPEREQKILSRCLAAHGIYLLTGCTEKEAAAAVWDGSDDNGIDGAYFEAPESRVVLVQSKWINKGTGEPEAKDIGAFTKGVKEVIEQDFANFHPRLHSRLSDICARLNTPGTSVHLALVTTGASKLAVHGTSVIHTLLSELNGADPEPIATTALLGLNEVYGGLVNDPLVGNVALEGQLLEWSYVPLPYPAYFGMVDGLQLKQWWKKHGKGLVAANIRHSLGATEVNNEIKNTATNNPDKFWYFNNGVTLVADEAIKAPAGAAARAAGIFSFKGASIVNGAQTVSSLAKVDDDVSLGKVRVAIRIILLKSAPTGFGNDVTKTNNFQNRIEPRDFAAQDPQQQRLRQEMAIEGVDYQFVRSEDFSPTETTCDLLEVTTALACSSGDANLAVQIKTGISRFFADLQKAPYKSIFNASTSGAYAFNATIVQRRVDNWIEKKKQGMTKKSGPKWGVLVHGNRILSTVVFAKLQAGRLQNTIGQFKGSLGTQEIETLCEEAHKKMVDAVQASYPGKFLAVLFKSPKSSKNVFDSALN